MSRAALADVVLVLCWFLFEIMCPLLFIAGLSAVMFAGGWMIAQGIEELVR